MLPILLAVLLAGCGSGYGAAGHSHLVTTDGAGVMPLTPGTRLVLLGPDSPVMILGSLGTTDQDAAHVVDTIAERWLQQHGMTVLDHATRSAVTAEQLFSLSNDERVRIGRQSGADIIVFRTYSRPLATVTVKGISVETGEVLWSGSASTTPDGDVSALNRPKWGVDWNGATISNPTREDWNRLADASVLRTLTCQALATAFRLQAPSTRAVEYNQGCNLH